LVATIVESSVKQINHQYAEFNRTFDLLSETTETEESNVCN